MDLQLHNKRAIVTGGSRGIGRAVARQLAHEGCAVAVVARSEDQLRAVAAELSEEADAGVLAVVGDTSRDDTAADMMRRATEALDGVDILVNAATSRYGGGPVRGLDAIETDALLDAVNDKVQGYVRCVQGVVPHMKSNGWGSIVNISGMAARFSGSPLTTIRNAAVVALTKNLADELGAHGINVTVVHPGITRTERTPDVLASRASASGRTIDDVEGEIAGRNALGRIITAEEVADVVTFLASPRSVAINGDVVPAGGGVGNAVYY